MEMNAIKAVYFVGIGGIGMSAIARYFLQKGLCVGGYDRTPSELTRKLQEEGARIHYEEDVEQIPSACRDKDTCLVVYTPAIPGEHAELAYFKANGFEIEKRAQVLGTLTRAHKGLCVAGTHGKTTTSSMAAHILHQSHVDCNAFFGRHHQELRYELHSFSEERLRGHRSRRVRPFFSLADAIRVCDYSH